MVLEIVRGGGVPFTSRGVLEARVNPPGVAMAALEEVLLLFVVAAEQTTLLVKTICFDEVVPVGAERENMFGCTTLVEVGPFRIRTGLWNTVEEGAGEERRVGSATSPTPERSVEGRRDMMIYRRRSGFFVGML